MITQKWKAKRADSLDFHDVTVTADSLLDLFDLDDWRRAATEGFVAGMADNWRIKNGQELVIDLIAPDLSCYKVRVRAEKTWNVNFLDDEG